MFRIHWHYSKFFTHGWTLLRDSLRVVETVKNESYLKPCLIQGLWNASMTMPCTIWVSIVTASNPSYTLGHLDQTFPQRLKPFPFPSCTCLDWNWTHSWSTVVNTNSTFRLRLPLTSMGTLRFGCTFIGLSAHLRNVATRFPKFPSVSHLPLRTIQVVGNSLDTLHSFRDRPFLVWPKKRCLGFDLHKFAIIKYLAQCLREAPSRANLMLYFKY